MLRHLAIGMVCGTIAGLIVLAVMTRPVEHFTSIPPSMIAAGAAFLLVTIVATMIIALKNRR